MEKIQTELPQQLSEMLEGTIEGYSVSKMSKSDQEFLYGLLQKIKPKKCLEVGVYSGGSSAIILDAIKDITDAKLYGVDILPTHPFLKDRKPGFIVDERFSDLASMYELLCGGDISAFIEKIGNDIDFALIDTAHFHPCECLNLLTILPFMKRDSWIVLHDIGLFYCEDNKPANKNCYATKYIWDSWVGDKMSSDKCERFTIPNIGAIKIENLDENRIKMISLLFNRWDMQIDNNVLNDVRNIIQTYYPKNELEYFDLIMKRKEYLKQFENEIIIDTPHSKNSFFNKIKRMIPNMKI